MTDSNEGEPPADAQLSIDVLLDLLAHRHRRVALRTMRADPENTVDEETLVASIQAAERDRTGKKPSANFVVRALHHVHTPKLRAAGVVTHLEDRGQYRYHPDERLEQWIELVESQRE